MNILIVTPTYFPIVGGAEVGIFELAKRLSLGHKIVILAPEFPALPPSCDEYFNHPEIKIVRYKNKKIFNNFHPRIERILSWFMPNWSVGATKAVSKVLSEHKIDVINCHYVFENTGLIKFLKKKSDIPVVVSVVGREFNEGRWRFANILALSALKKSNKVIFISKYMEKISGFRRGTNKIIYYGTDLNRYRRMNKNHDLMKELNIQDGNVVLFSVQRLTRIKRLDILLFAFRKVLNTVPEAVLVVSGTGGDENRLRQLADKLGLSEHLRWRGFVKENDLPKYYSCADIVTFHSLNETFGVVIAQAMACAKPLVAVNSTAMPELVENGVTGLLARPYDPDDYADKIISLIKNKGLAESISLNAQKFAENNFSWNKIALEYEAVFLEAAGSK